MESSIRLCIKKAIIQIIYVKLNLIILYPPPYEREIWHFKYANTDLIQRAINSYSWERSLAEKDFNEKFYIFTKTIFSNFFHTKQFSVMTEIHRGSVTKLKV